LWIYFGIMARINLKSSQDKPIGSELPPTFIGSIANTAPISSSLQHPRCWFKASIDHDNSGFKTELGYADFSGLHRVAGCQSHFEREEDGTIGRSRKLGLPDAYLFVDPIQLFPISRSTFAPQQKMQASVSKPPSL